MDSLGFLSKDCGGQCTLGRVSRTAIATSWLPFRAADRDRHGRAVGCPHRPGPHRVGSRQRHHPSEHGDPGRLAHARAATDLAAVAAVGFALLPLLAGERTSRVARPVFARARTAVIARRWCGRWRRWPAPCCRRRRYRPDGTAVSFTDLRSYVDTVAGARPCSSWRFALVQALLAGAATRSVVGAARIDRGLRSARCCRSRSPDTPPCRTPPSTRWCASNCARQRRLTGGLAAIVALAARHRALLATVLPRFLTGHRGVRRGGGHRAPNGLALLIENPGAVVAGPVHHPYGQPGGRTVAGGDRRLGGYTRWKPLPNVIRHRRTALVSFAVELALMGLALFRGRPRPDAADVMCPTSTASAGLNFMRPAPFVASRPKRRTAA